MSKEKAEHEEVEIQEKKAQGGIVSEGELSEKANSENDSEYDEEDLLYTHKPENRSGSIQWNSNFCRRPGH